MQIYFVNFKGLNAVVMENKWLKLVVLPELGAKIASLIYKPQNFEVFFQPTDGCFRLSAYGAAFADFDTAGADEMYPTIDACKYPCGYYEGLQLPDHGELWSVPWRMKATGNRLCFKTRGRVLPYEFKRAMYLHDGCVQMEYQIVNTGDKPLYGVWAFHGLVACDESTQIILPEITTVVNVHESAKLGSAGTLYNFPETVDKSGATFRLDGIKPRTANDTEKLYVNGKVKTGQAALTLNNNRLLYQLMFPENKVPYLGIWINQGGFKGEYNCALEPASGFYDSPEIAYKLGSIEPLAPGTVLQWYLNIKLEELP